MSHANVYTSILEILIINLKGSWFRFLFCKEKGEFKSETLSIFGGTIWNIVTATLSSIKLITLINIMNKYELMSLSKDNSMPLKLLETNTLISKRRFSWHSKINGSNRNKSTIKLFLLSIKAQFNVNLMLWNVGNGSCIIKKLNDPFYL